LLEPNHCFWRNVCLLGQITNAQPYCSTSHLALNGKHIRTLCGLALRGYLPSHNLTGFGFLNNADGRAGRYQHLARPNHNRSYQEQAMAKHAHTTDADRRRSSRRTLLLGAAVMPGAASAAALAPSPPLSPDAELIALCNRHPALLEAFNVCDEDSGPNNPAWVAYVASMDAISDAKPLTFEGVCAKALAAKAEAMMPDGSEHSDGSIAAHWAWDIANDMLRLTGGAA
jgi:hypothetical protein